MKKRLIVLGSTGSIGTKVLEIVRDFPDNFEVVALSTNSSVELLAAQAREFQPQAVCVCNPDATTEARNAASSGRCRFHAGESGLVELVEQYDADVVVVATVGFVGLRPTLRAIERSMTIALANKEVLVTAGELVMNLAQAHNTQLLPIDSEHNAVFQCLNGSGPKAIRRIVLTASGGPFRGASRQQLESTTREQALNHPTWQMGPKITIDSATLMNKGLEVIEAHFLFGIPTRQIEVVVHPQSTIHSMVEYVDGSIIAQLGKTDMYLPIQNVLFYPDRVPNKFPSLDFSQLQQLTFEKPDLQNFPCLSYAYEAADRGGTYPAVLNAANEVAVSRFLEGEIRFLKIPEIVRAALDSHNSQPAADLETIASTDRWARELAGTIA